MGQNNEFRFPADLSIRDLNRENLNNRERQPDSTNVILLGLKKAFDGLYAFMDSPHINI